MPRQKQSKRMFIMLEVDAKADASWSAKEVAAAVRAAVTSTQHIEVLQVHVNVAKKAAVAALA